MSGALRQKWKVEGGWLELRWEGPKITPELLAFFAQVTSDIEAQDQSDSGGEATP